MSDGITEARRKLSDEEMILSDLKYLKNIAKILNETITNICNRIEYKKEHHDNV